MFDKYEDEDGEEITGAQAAAWALDAFTESAIPDYYTLRSLGRETCVELSAELVFRLAEFLNRDFGTQKDELLEAIKQRFAREG